MTDTIQFSTSDITDITVGLGLVRYHLDCCKKDVGLITINDIQKMERVIDDIAKLILYRAINQGLSQEQILKSQIDRLSSNPG
jgi:hypothetical protein